MFTKLTLDNQTFSVGDAEYLQRLGFNGDELVGLHAEQISKGLNVPTVPTNPVNLL